MHDTNYKTTAERDGFGWVAAKERSKVIGASWLKPGFEQTDDDPVVEVSWYDAVAFCRWLSRKEGKIYRLPSEAEWEYACRAGTTTAFYNGDDGTLLDQIGWFMESGKSGTHPIGQKLPNAWGLYDMLGNVRQWCSDWYAPYDAGNDITDPVGPAAPADAKGRVMRGGAWAFDRDGCRCALRSYGMDGAQCNWIGFRVCLPMENSDAAK